MAINKDDLVIPFTSSDGKLIARRVSIASSENELMIPARSSDGKLIAVKVVKMSTEDDIGITALSSDGKLIAIKTVVGAVLILVPDTITAEDGGFTGENWDAVLLWEWSDDLLSVGTEVREEPGIDIDWAVDRGITITGSHEVRIRAILQTGSGLLKDNTGTNAPIVDGKQTLTETVLYNNAKLFKIQFRYSINTAAKNETISIQFIADIPQETLTLQNTTRSVTVIKFSTIGDSIVRNATRTGEFDNTNWSTNQLTNGDFTNWTADNPDNWTVTGEVTTDPEISEVGTGQGHGGAGTGFCNIFTTSDAVSIKQNVTLVNTKTYEISFDIDTVTTGSIRVFDSGASAHFDKTFNSTGVKFIKFTAASTSATIQIENVGSADITIDEVFVDRDDAWDDAHTDYLGTPDFSDSALDLENGCHSFAPKGTDNSVFKEIDFWTHGFRIFSASETLTDLSHVLVGISITDGHKIPNFWKFEAVPYDPFASAATSARRDSATAAAGNYDITQLGGTTDIVFEKNKGHVTREGNGHGTQCLIEITNFSSAFKDSTTNNWNFVCKTFNEDAVTVPRRDYLATVDRFANKSACLLRRGGSTVPLQKD